MSLLRWVGRVVFSAALFVRGRMEFRSMDHPEMG
jgi:hypothetical protein